LATLSRTSNQQPIAGLVQTHHLRQHRILVLNAMCLVNDEVLPLEALEVGLLSNGDLIAERKETIGKQPDNSA
jgi:hypothetical protein